MQGYLQNRGGALSGPQASGPGIGALDPYAFKAAEHTAQGAEDHLATPPQKMRPIDHLGRLLPMAGAALATGGLAIPFAAAFAAGSTAHQLQKERREQFEYEKNKNLAAGEIYGRASEQYRAGLPASVSAAPKSIKWVETFDDEGKPVHRPTNALTGEPMGEDLPRDPSRRRMSDYELFALDMTGKSYLDLPPEQQKTIRDAVETTSATRSRLAGNRIDVLSGEEGLSAAGERGKRIEQERYDLRQELRGIEDEIGMKEVAVDYLKDLREALANDEIGADTPFPEVEQYFNTAAARLNRMVRELQLAGLADQTLTPVSNEDLKILLASVMNPRLSKEKKLAQFDDFIEGKMKEIRQSYQKAQRRQRLLGTEPEPAAPAAPAAEPFDANAEIDKILKELEDQ